MSQSLQTRLGDYIVLPRAAGAGVLSVPNKGVIPSCVTIAISNAAKIVDLRGLAGVPLSTNTQQSEGSNQVGSVGHYLTFVADGCDAYIISGPTFASVDAPNAPVAQTAQAAIVTTGATVATVASCLVLKDGVHYPFLPVKDIDNFVSIVTKGAATGFFTIVQSSP